MEDDDNLRRRRRRRFWNVNEKVEIKVCGAGGEVGHGQQQQIANTFPIEQLPIVIDDDDDDDDGDDGGISQSSQGLNKLINRICYGNSKQSKVVVQVETGGAAGGGGGELVDLHDEELIHNGLYEGFYESVNSMEYFEPNQWSHLKQQQQQQQSDGSYLSAVAAAGHLEATACRYEDEYEDAFNDDVIGGGVVVGGHVTPLVTYVIDDDDDEDEVAAATVRDVHNMAATTATPVAKPYKCKKCNKSFASGQFLYFHDKAQHEQKNIVCDVCDARFATQERLTKHMKCHPAVKRPPVTHGCVYCGKEFEKKRHLNAHVAKDHVMEAAAAAAANAGVEFKCETCGKSFRQNSSLAIHRTMHTRQKLYKCKSCPESFSQLRGLASHEQQHVDNDKKQWPCDLCHKRYVNEGTLATHKKKVHRLVVKAEDKKKQANRDEEEEGEIKLMIDESKD